MNAEEFWQEFVKKNPSYEGRTYDAWAYGSVPDELAQLTLEGVKTATSSGYDLYVLEDEPLPQVGMLNVILDGLGDAVCLTENVAVTIHSFNEVPEEIAYHEGEGDRSLRYWRKVHWTFFQEEYAKAGLSFTESKRIVTETFKRIYP